MPKQKQTSRIQFGTAVEIHAESTLDWIQFVLSVLPGISLVGIAIYFVKLRKAPGTAHMLQPEDEELLEWEGMLDGVDMQAVSFC